MIARAIAIAAPPENAPDGWDAADARDAGWTYAMCQKLIDDALPYKQSEQKSSSGRKQPKARKESRTDLVLSVVAEMEVWHDESGDVYVTLPINGHFENWPLRSREVNRWISERTYRLYGELIGKQAIDDVLVFLDAKGASEGACHKTWRRVGRLDQSIYLDLCRADWQVVEITSEGWQVLDRSPIKFLRSPAMRSLPSPEPGESIDRLRRFVNVFEESDFQRIVSWLIAALRPDGPYPLAVISGEQGSGKSNFSRLLRSLVDPNLAPIRTPPKEDRDLIVAATNSHVQALDNLSSVPVWLSDCLCRLATGGGFSVRAVYTNESEHVIAVIKPVILNGIPDLSDRADLADRSLSFYLAQLPADERRTEAEFWQDFEAEKPAILGALLDGVCCGIRRLPSISLKTSPRMADFAAWIEACAPAFGWEEGEFLAAYEANRSNIAKGAFEADPLAVNIQNFMSDKPHGWEGTATDLLSQLNAIAPESIQKTRTWPKVPAAMGSGVRRVAPLLRRIGINVETGHSGDRFIRIAWINSPSGENCDY